MVLVCRQVHEIESLNGNVKIMTMSFDDVRRGGSYLEDGFTILLKGAADNENDSETQDVVGKLKIL